MAAWEYRALYDKVANEFPGEYGVVPPELLEAIVDLESGGNKNAQTGTATGLGQIMPAGMEYGLAINNPKFVEKYGNAPNLYDPETNIAIMTIGLAGRRDAGMKQREQQGYGAWADWYGATLGYFGAVGNDRDPGTGVYYQDAFTPADSLDNGDGNYTGIDYLRHVANYSKGFAGGTWSSYTDIDKQGPGAFHPTNGDYSRDALYYDMDTSKFLGNAGDWIKKTSVDIRDQSRDVTGGALDYARDAWGYLKQIDDALKKAVEFAPRAGVLVMGVVLIVGGFALWSV